MVRVGGVVWLDVCLGEAFIVSSRGEGVQQRLAC